MGKTVELKFLVCKINIINLSETHLDIYLYLIAKNTISSAEKLKIMATVSSVRMNPSAGHQHILSPFIASLLYPYLCSVWVHTPVLII